MTPQECVIKLIEELAETLERFVFDSYPMPNDWSHLIILWDKTAGFDIKITIFTDYLECSPRLLLYESNIEPCPLKIEFYNPNLITIVEKFINDTARMYHKTN